MHIINNVPLVIPCAMNLKNRFSMLYLRCMETIWDHNPNEQELTNMFGDHTLAPKAEDVDEDVHLAYLAWLFQTRNDGEKALAYAQQIRDADYREDVIKSLQELAESPLEDL